jgi:selT/selW/selH-like putative selenoprotein
VKPTLVKGKGGVFDIEANGQLVFSKFEKSRFPDTPEVLDALASLGP